MFRSFRIATLLGIPVSVHWSLVLLASYFVATSFRDGGAEAAAWTACVIVMVFGSVLAHEYGHIVAARWYGIGAKAVNLSMLGGVAFLDAAPKRPLHQAVVALAGPAVSLALALASLVWAAAAYGASGLDTAAGHLFAINTLLLLFNLLPVYPMDGGQVLRAALEAWRGKESAGRISRLVGQAGGAAMTAGGLWTGSWSLALIGGFIVVAVSMESRSERQAAAPRGRAQALDGDVIPPPRPSSGVFVAFDGEGRHFAYAKHWLGPHGADEDQLRTVAEYEIEARRKGGRLVLMSAEEFGRLVAAESV